MSLHRLKMRIVNFVSTLSRRKKLAGCGLVLVLFIFWASSSDTVVTRLRQDLNIMPCTDVESQNVIKEICSLYQDRQIEGDLCQSLCSSHLIEFKQCLNYRHGKYVIEVQCKNVCKLDQTVPAILKMTRLNSSSIKSHLESIDGELLNRLQLPESASHINIDEPFITAESLSILTTDLLNEEYGFIPGEEDDVLSILWSETYPKHFKGTKTNLLFARSFWSLVQQNEFRISKVFNEWEVFPQIYGACGPLYLAENAPSVKSLESSFPFLNMDFPSWRNRAKLAISILDLVDRMDNMERRLHICDVKSPHFGFTPEHQVRFIDADTVFTDETMNRDLGAPVCSEHHDCAFFDCEGWCQKNKGLCTPIRTNNNLQMVCAKNFLGPVLSAYGGLLTTPPRSVAAKLTALVNSCASDVTEKVDGMPMKTPSQDILSSLKRMLLESLNADAIA